MTSIASRTVKPGGFVGSPHETMGTESRGAALTALGMANTWIGGVDVAKSICAVPACERPARSRGWCNMHWKRWRRYGDPEHYPAHGGTCAVEGCERPLLARGVCGAHWARWNRTGDLQTHIPVVELGRSPYERVMATVTETDGHWITSAISRIHGYGQVRDGARMLKSHRVTYEHHRGPIPEGMVIDHLCRVKACVNPDHLEVVTQSENCRRIDRVGRRWVA